MKTSFTKFQNELILSVEKYMAEGDSFDDSVMFTAKDHKVKEFYVKETYLSYKVNMVMVK